MTIWILSYANGSIASVFQTREALELWLRELQISQGFIIRPRTQPNLWDCEAVNVFGDTARYVLEAKEYEVKS